MAAEQLKVVTPKAVTSSLLGRTIWRVILHTGISTTPPPRLSAEKGLFHTQSPWAKPMGRPTADEMTVADNGIYCRFGNYEKLVPWANVYEMDLAPA